MGKLQENASVRFGKTYEIFFDAIHEMREKRKLDEDFDLRVKGYCISGMEREFILEMHEILRGHHGPRQKVAEFFGMRDGSSVSQQKRHGSMKGDHWVLMLVEYLDEVTKCFRCQETCRRALTRGYLEAFTQIRTRELSPTPEAEPSARDGDTHAAQLKEEDLDRLQRLFRHEDWPRALAANDRTRLALIAAEIFGTTHKPATSNPRDTIPALRQLVRDWGEAYLLGVGALLDLPEDNQ